LPQAFFRFLGEIIVTEQYAQPSINLADTGPGVPVFLAVAFDPVNPVGTTDTTGARFDGVFAQSGIEYFQPPIGDPLGDAGQIIISRPGVYLVTYSIGLTGGATALGITWENPNAVGPRPLITNDPAAPPGINSPPAGLTFLRAYGRNNAPPSHQPGGL